MKLTFDQVAARKEKAVRFVDKVLDDPERADEIAAESVEDYAARRKIDIVENNPDPGRQTMNKAELQQRLAEIEAENQVLEEKLETILDVLDPEDDEDPEGENEDEDDPDDSEGEE